MILPQRTTKSTSRKTESKKPNSLRGYRLGRAHELSEVIDLLGIDLAREHGFIDRAMRLRLVVGEKWR
jgi:hypothetical protein